MAAKIDAVQLAGLLSYIAKAADVDTADSIAAHIAALEQERDEYREQMQLAEQRANLLDDDLRHCRDERDSAVADNAALVVQMKGASAALQQPKTFPADIALAISFLDVADQPHPGAAMLEEHRRALVRARNEGLERATKKNEARACTIADARRGLGGDADCCAVELRELADEIRAMKEPESD